MSEPVHFVGVAGSGMSALAQFHAMGGGEATGSDRFLDRGGLPELRAKLEALGVRLFPQDGSAVVPGRRVVASAAVETANPDLRRAAELGIAASPRAQFLAERVERFRTLAVAGTSGKSTATAMLYEILSSVSSPSLITGAPLRRLEREGYLGNAFRGSSGELVIEADESDGTLPRYKPWLGLLLNMGKDHKELAELAALFKDFRERCSVFVLNGDARSLESLRPGSVTFGFSPGCDVLAEGLRLEARGTFFSVRGVPFRLEAPGRHNVENALGAAAAALQAGVSLEHSAEALARYQGVARRFESLGTAGGVEVIDDYAHNPDKVRSALAAAHLRSRRVLAVYQPHGYGPTRFLKNEFIAAFREALGPEDVLWLPEIYYAGGSAVKDISSADLVAPLARAGLRAAFVEDRNAIPALAAAEARPGDVILVMGARDPGLGAFARQILAALTGKSNPPA